MPAFWAKRGLPQMGQLVAQLVEGGFIAARQCDMVASLYHQAVARGYTAVMVIIKRAFSTPHWWHLLSGDRAAAARQQSSLICTKLWEELARASGGGQSAYAERSNR